MAVTRKASKPKNLKYTAASTKVPVQLVPPALIAGAARALAEGADKYEAWNYRTAGVSASTYIGAILRHVLQYLDGEDIDTDSISGKLHLEGIAASVAILLDATYAGYLTDDRPLSGPGLHRPQPPGRQRHKARIGKRHRP